MTRGVSEDDPRGPRGVLGRGRLFGALYSVVVLFRALLCGLDVPFYANWGSCSLIGPFVPRGTKCCSLIGCGVDCRGILLRFKPHVPREVYVICSTD